MQEIKEISLLGFSGQCSKCGAEITGLTRKQVENNLRVHEMNCTGTKSAPQSEKAEA